MKMDVFGYYNMEELSGLGYEPIGKPALLVEHPRTVKDEQLQHAIEITNKRLTYDAIIFYWKTDANYDAPIEKGHTQIIGDAGGLSFLIVQALKKKLR